MPEQIPNELATKAVWYGGGGAAGGIGGDAGANGGNAGGCV